MSERHKIKGACFLALLKDEKTYLLKRSNTHYCEGFWGVPAGHIEAGETPLEGAAREVKEEAGVDVKIENCAFVCSQYRIEEDATYADYFFATTEWEGEPHVAEPKKASAGGWFSLSELPEDTVPVDISLLESLLTGDIYVEYDETKKEA